MFVNSPQFDVLWFASTMSVGGPEMKFVARGVINVTSKGRTVEQALNLGERYLGKGYKEIGKPGSGVFRSSNNTRQFRITESDLLGKHGDIGPHVHFEKIDPATGDVMKNIHTPLY
jgi:hypothetical protein